MPQTTRVSADNQGAAVSRGQSRNRDREQTEEVIASHASALEYWRLPGTRENVVPVEEPLACLMGATARTAFVRGLIQCRSTGLSRLTTPIHVLVGSHNLCHHSEYLCGHTMVPGTIEGTGAEGDARGCDAKGRNKRNAGSSCPKLFVELGRGTYVVSPELCFVQLCENLPIHKAIELAFELCGTYAKGATPGAPTSFNRFALTDRASLRGFLDRYPRIRGAARASRAIKYISEGSASPMETALAMLLCLPPALGGYGFPMPRLNRPIGAPSKSRTPGSRKNYRIDLLWETASFGLEYDGVEHHSKDPDVLNDSRRRAALDCRGYGIQTVRYSQIASAEEFHTIAHLTAKHIGRRIQLPKGFEQRREELRAALGLGEA